MRLDTLPTVLQAATLSEVVVDNQGKRLSPTEQGAQLAILKFVIKTLLFLIARPSALTASKPVKPMSSQITEHHHKLFFPEAKSKEQASHYRRGHIRQLRHERFYQGEWASTPVGSRLVFVSEAHIGEDQIHFVESE